MRVPVLNTLEGGCVVAAGIMVALLFRIRRCTTRETVCGIAVVVPALIVAATSFTRFLSWDESYIFYDVVNYYGNELRQWRYGSFRTTTTYLGPLLAGIQYLFPITKDVILVAAKVLHWLVGMALMLLIVDQAHRVFVRRVPFVPFFCVACTALLLLPVNGLALKTLNYDLLSMELGVLGCIWLVAGMQPMRKSLLYMAVVALTLASHEKLIASPLLWMVLFAVPVRCAIASSVNVGEMMKKCVRESLTVVSLSSCVVAVSFVIVLVTHGPNAPPLNVDQVSICWMSALWPFLRIAGSTYAQGLEPESVGRLLADAGCRMVSMGVVISVVAGVFSLLCRWGENVVARAEASANLLKRVEFLGGVSVAGVIVTGIAAGYMLQVKIWPLIQVDDGNYVPVMTFNGIAHHFGCRTLFTHTLASVAWTCSVFVNALPTPVLLLLLTGVVITLKAAAKKKEPDTYRSLILMTFFTMMPVLYGLLQIPLYPRYLNLFLFGAVITAVCYILKNYYVRKIGFRVLCTVAAVFVYIEVMPFLPLGATFRPLWSNYSEEFNRDPGFGKVTPWYPGWGEELFEAYEKIVQVDNCTGVRLTLYHNFPAALIRPSARVLQSAMPVGHGEIPYRYREHDYYILSRNGVSSYTCIPFPYGIQPLFVLSDRGFVNAWVFKGSDLAGAGFRF